jgi:predicted amino acid-binding ACT domain protein
MVRPNRAVVSVIGRDQKGVVASISTYLASCNINIEDIEQRVMEGLFIMTMLVDLSDLDTSLDDMILGLKRIGQEIQMDVSVRLHRSSSRCRITRPSARWRNSAGFLSFRSRIATRAPTRTFCSRNSAR